MLTTETSIRGTTFSIRLSETHDDRIYILTSPESHVCTFSISLTQI